MSRADTIRAACMLMSLVSAGHEYSEPNDGFCDECPAATHPDWEFRNTGNSIRFIRDAVVNELRLRGKQVSDHHLMEFEKLFEKGAKS